ncbi:hypothetical protein ACJMK2_007932 [Sinanodonta woodiana]|uniref:Uncharacterized protein n=1 Tax=Sinanodonta woodiana TaxID=1069815 RepID=A0ABD3VK05_SINWO
MSTEENGDNTGGKVENDAKPAYFPVPKNVKQLTPGQWHSGQEAYKLITKKVYVHSEVPLGNKSNCFLLKKCEFYDNGGVWDTAKGNTVKSIFVIKNGHLINLEHKNKKYCLKKSCKGQVYWVSLEPQPAEDSIVILSRYYAALKTDPTFKKRVSYFVNNVNQT